MTLRERQVATEILLDHVVVPLTEEVSNDRRKHVRLRVLVASGGNIETFHKSIRRASASGNAEGEIRIMLAKKAGHKVSFFGEAIFPDLALDSGFSGFSVRGTINAGAHPPKVASLARKNRYNVWNWAPSLQWQTPQRRL